MRRQHSKAARRPAHLSGRGQSTFSLNTRPLRFEPLEDRRLLAITVNTLVDELDGSVVDGDISLRDAIAASPAGDEINFSVTGTIGLSLGQLSIDKDLTINGPGANLLTIDQNTAGNRVFSIDDGTEALADVAISGLTVTGGNASLDVGGGILNSENLTLTSATITGNSAGDDGGGIGNEGGVLTIVGSTISGNSAGDGGGISNSGGTVTITNSTLSGNSASYRSGGIHNSGTLTITNSTLSGNSAVNGGGIQNGGTTTIAGSILTGNSASTGSEISNFSTVILNAFNLIGDSGKTTAQALSGVAAGGTDILGTSNGTNPTALAAILAPLADNGGSTLTHSLVAGSPAINAGNPAATGDFDQRGTGFPRVVNGRIDIGAYEFALVVDTLVDENDGIYTAGNLSLREAIELANSNPGADEITFSVTGTINIASQLPTITDALTITGLGANLLTINAGNGTDDLPATLDGFRIFNIDNASATLIDVAISGLTLTGGDTMGQGGGILNRGNLTLTASTVSGNASDGGGGIANSAAGTLTITSSTVSGNRAGNAGGIANFGGTVILTESAVSGNQAGAGYASLGGGFYSRDGGTVIITGSTLSGNSAGFGGGFYSRDGGTVTITGSTISSNLAGNGGGVSIRGGTATITGSTISGNSATFSGGGIVNYYGAATIAGSTLSGNSAGYNGGGLWQEGGTSTITGSLITGNSASTGSEIFRYFGGTTNLNAFNLIGESSKTTAQSLYGVTGGATDILATSNGTNPTALAAILAPLADNGGSTLTHSLVAGSPAINAGSPVVDLAPGGVATQSSEYPISFPAGNAIDGNPSTFTSTAVEDANATWQVTMPIDSVVTQVVLHNRLEAQSRLRDITVEVLNASGVVVATSALLNPENILGGGQVDVGPATLTFDLVADTGGAVVGRTIRVRRTGDPDLSGSGGQGNEGEPNILSLGEVEVLGVAGDPGTDQRGTPFSRIFGGRIDIGAYEFQALAMVVDTLTDESDGDYSAGDLSLREAMQLANANPGADTIGFDAGLAGGTINIASQLPTITGAVTITGLGANLLTIDAGNGTDHLPATLDGFRIFNIDNASATLIDVAISGLTLTGGDTMGQGGGILSRENLTLTASTLSGNASDGGGGIVNFLGTATVTDSTISGNSAGNGGGIANFGGTLVLTNSTVSGNQAGAGYGGEGGGILSNYGTLTIAGTTITGNAAGGSGGGGGIKTFGVTATITNSLITGNSAPKGREIASNYSTINLNGFNLIGDSSKTTAQALYGASAGATDILATSNGTNPSALAAIIAPLANNGGPTQTHALVAGSPARDAGNPGFTSPPDFDQRGAGYQRVVNGRVDIGAYEVQAPSADFDGDGDVDGRDFLAWQRGFGTPAPTAVKAQGDADNDLAVDGTDLGVWQLQYGTVPGPVVAEQTISDLGFMISDLEVETAEVSGEGSGITDLRLDLRGGSVAVSRRETATDVETVFEDSYIEEVDRAFDELSTVQQYGVREFGEMVARRGVDKRFDVGNLRLVF